MLRILFILFLTVPLLEIFLLIQVGNVIGAVPTIALVVLTALVGALLVKYQGVATLFRVRQALARHEVPAMALLEGAVLLVAGALFLTPGFFTDAVAFLALIPGVRRYGISLLLSRFVLVRLWGEEPGAPRDGPPRGGGRTIEGESRRED
jgi:UPF0716 protein FxsA